MTEKASDTRNRRRTVEKDTNDERTLSKYLPNDISDVIGGPIEGPDDVFVPLEWLMEEMKDVYDTHTITLIDSPVRFTTDPDSLAFNEELLARHSYDMGALIHSASGSTMDPSSEIPTRRTTRRYLFRPPTLRVCKEHGRTRDGLRAHHRTG
jgi:hypothetical protein